jgi:ankyrin repeat protein
MAELLLAHGADVRHRDTLGNTPLHEAGFKDLAELLLANGADVNATDNDGETPLSYADNSGWKDVAELLRRHGGRSSEWALARRYGNARLSQ